MKHGNHTTDELGNNTNRLLGEDLSSSLKASELRIGNLVDRENTGNHVTISATHLVNWNKMRRFLFPLKLTDEWLLKFGFSGANDEAGVYYEYNKHRVYIFKDSFEFEFNSHGCSRFNLFKSYKYVHQLQNLYFALTCEELTC